MVKPCHKDEIDDKNIYMTNKKLDEFDIHKWHYGQRRNIIM
jgi:hypothetical protein